MERVEGGGEMEGIRTPHDRPHARDEVHDPRLDARIAARPRAEAGVVGRGGEVYCLAVSFLSPSNILLTPFPTAILPQETHRVKSDRKQRLGRRCRIRDEGRGTYSARGSGPQIGSRRR